MPNGSIAADDPRAEDVRALLERHLAFARGHSPPEDAHALDADGLADPDVTFFSYRADGHLLAVGALKRLDDGHAEVKSMHTIERARGRGIGRAMVEHLLAVARERGFRRVSLETGAMDAFAPARALYAGAGFEPCGPFGDYGPSRNSVFMTLPLSRVPAVASPNIEVVRANSAAFSRRDVDAMLKLYAPGAVVIDRREVGWGEFRGHDALRSYYQGLFDNADDLHEDLEVVAEQGDTLVAACRLTARLSGQPEGSEVSFDYALRIRLANGVIAAIDIYDSAEDATAAP